MSAAFTPGPWTADGVDVWALDDCHHHAIADCDTSSSCRMSEECEANARLIAAAPLMLEALQMVRGYVVSMKGKGHGYQVAIDAAIAAALGEQP